MASFVAMARNVYSDEFRAEAVTLSEQIGTLDAAKQLGVRTETLRSWRTRAGVATLRVEETRAATEAVKVDADQRRARLGERLLELAEKSTERAEELIGDANLRDIVGALDYAIKNAQLLTGAATSRTEHTAGKEAAHAVADELKARRDKQAA
jgi:transposase-like protein